ncbi:MAG: HAMP domain-containing protein, partial [Pseudomonadales bacterium]|nr:HAMP domain-containing protein [Pseudomonadales bacterium]
MSIRARIFFVFAATVIVGFTLLMNWISEDVSDRYSESFEEIMVDSANMLAEIISNDINNADNDMMQLGQAFDRLAQRRFSAKIYDMEKTSVDIRVYVTDAGGKVIFDSDNNAAVGEDYSDWLDVSRTLKGEYGARATRVPGKVSAGDPDQPLTIAYVAAPIYRDGDIVGSVTLAKPKTNIDRFVANARASLKFAVMFSIVLALLLGFMLYTWVSQPLQKLVDFTNRVSKGERIPPPALGNNEIGEVAGAIENMRQALEDKQYVETYVQTLTHELKSPLTAIQASAELLEQDLPADKRAQFTRNIINETRRLNEFANQLLALAALE